MFSNNYSNSKFHRHTRSKNISSVAILKEFMEFCNLKPSGQFFGKGHMAVPEQISDNKDQCHGLVVSSPFSKTKLHGELDSKAL